MLTFQCSSFLSLPAKAHAGMVVLGSLRPHCGLRAFLGIHAHGCERPGGHLVGQGNDAGGKNVLGLVAPAGDGPLRLGVLSPDEADEHVDTSDGEEEERGNESEGVDAMGEDSSANAE